MSEVTITERGWPGHFIGNKDCIFRRNTLIECGDKKVVVSTVGGYVPEGHIMTIGHERWFETMAFEAEYSDGYWDADVTKPIEFDSNWCLCAETKEELHEKYPHIDNSANEMHDAVVAELTERMESTALE